MNELLRKKNYEYYMKRAECCEDCAGIYKIIGEDKVSQFYLNAAEGFKIKAQKLKLKDA